jgi:hypothetical protein
MRVFPSKQGYKNEAFLFTLKNESLRWCTRLIFHQTNIIQYYRFEMLRHVIATFVFLGRTTNCFGRTEAITYFVRTQVSFAASCFCIAVEGTNTSFFQVPWS